MKAAVLRGLTRCGHSGPGRFIPSADFMGVGVTDRLWEIDDIVKVPEDWEAVEAAWAGGKLLFL
jgi:hypothetical protein